MTGDLATIRAAVAALPATCRYHEDRIDPGPGLFGREGCCDTGRPALLRRRAEEALTRLEAR